MKYILALAATIGLALIANFLTIADVIPSGEAMNAYHFFAGFTVAWILK